MRVRLLNISKGEKKKEGTKNEQIFSLVCTFFPPLLFGPISYNESLRARTNREEKHKFTNKVNWDFGSYTYVLIYFSFGFCRTLYFDEALSFELIRLSPYCNRFEFYSNLYLRLIFYFGFEKGAVVRIFGRLTSNLSSLIKNKIFLK